jgi:thiamine-monophosphate kinase
VSVGPGDDAAVLEDGWVVSTDLAMEDVHFRRDWLSPDEIGARAVAAALSDLAAMAADPIAILVSMAGSKQDLESGLMEAVGVGARDAARACGAALIGGDLSRSPGPLVIDVVALGRAISPVLRSGAKVGDVLYVTGRLGGAAAALEFLQRGERPPEELRRMFARPTPRLGEARLLASSDRLHALIDLSDGLAGDVRHLAAASGVGVDVDVDAVPVATWMEAGATFEPRRRALTGGEDYELLFAANPSIEDTFEDLAAAFPDLPVTRVGRVVEGREVRFLDSDGSSIDPGGGWDHFDSAAREEPT